MGAWIEKDSEVLSPGRAKVLCSRLALIVPLIACTSNVTVLAQGGPSRTIPSRIIPVPGTVSPELQRLLTQPPGPSAPPPKTIEEWKAIAEDPASVDAAAAERLEKLGSQFGVTVVPQKMSGVGCYVVTPKVVQPKNRDRILLSLHPGGFIRGAAGRYGTEWAIKIASVTGYKVIVVDYRLLPDHPFPAAIDDAMAVWKYVITSTKPSNVAVIGASVGAGMAMSLVQRAKSEGLPLPGVVVSISAAAADLSKTGDSNYTNDGVDGNASYDGFWEAVWKLYANGRHLKDPLVSPLYGDFKGFPPTFLVTGTRDLYLSDTVRVHRRLLQAGASTQLVVVESLPHTAMIMMDLPEVAETYSYVAQFIDAHLGR
jgi:monoterpene epsilon-lactone hydrolase